MVDIHLFAVPSDANRADIRLRVNAAAGGFPPQFLGLRVYDGAVVDLCLVAIADGNAGPQVRVRKGATTYVAYLVDTTDPDASNVRLRVGASTKSVRRYTP